MLLLGAPLLRDPPPYAGLRSAEPIATPKELIAYCKANGDKD